VRRQVIGIHLPCNVIAALDGTYVIGQVISPNGGLVI
jgi:hypothetical protein